MYVLCTCNCYQYIIVVCVCEVGKNWCDVCMSVCIVFIYKCVRAAQSMFVYITDARVVCVYYVCVVCE